MKASHTKLASLGLIFGLQSTLLPMQKDNPKKISPHEHLEKLRTNHLLDLQNKKNIQEILKKIGTQNLESRSNGFAAKEEITIQKQQIALAEAIIKTRTQELTECRQILNQNKGIQASYEKELLNINLANEARRKKITRLLELTGELKPAEAYQDHLRKKVLPLIIRHKQEQGQLPQLRKQTICNQDQAEEQKQEDLQLQEFLVEKPQESIDSRTSSWLPSFWRS